MIHVGKEQDEKLFAFLGVFLTVIGFAVVMLAKPNSRYAMYYARQGLVLFIAWIIIYAAGILPFIGWIIRAVGNVLLLILWIIGIVYSLSGKRKPIPVIGQFTGYFKV